MVNKTFVVPDALSLEYKRKYGYATGQIKLSDIVNYPPIASEFRRLGLGFSEEFTHFIVGDIGMFGDDTSDTFLISTNSI